MRKERKPVRAKQKPQLDKKRQIKTAEKSLKITIKTSPPQEETSLPVPALTRNTSSVVPDTRMDRLYCYCKCNFATIKGQQDAYRLKREKLKALIKGDDQS